MQNTPNHNFWSFNINYWYQALGSSPTGLSTEKAREKLQNEGRSITSNGRVQKMLVLFWSQFKSPLMLMLLGAVILSAFLGETTDVYIILFIVLSTGLLSFYQEHNASQVVEKLQAMIALKFAVIRGGLVVDLFANDIVTGDILQLNAGDMLPADCLIIASNELHANEASLTGESFPVLKMAGILPVDTALSQRSNCLWEGTSIVSGSAQAMVVNVGEQTIFGSIAHSAGLTVETTFEKGIKEFGYFLMKITLVLSFFILVVNLLNHKSVMESALFALALAVGMAPELLPAITTIAMSAGAKRLLNKKVIVKKLSSIQNLGEVNLLCTDKTGTITEGAIQVAGVVDGLGNANDFVKELAYWNASFESGYANPIDETLKALKFDTKLSPQKIGEVPYDFIRKRLSIGIAANNENVLICKGAYTQIMEICTKIRLSDERVLDMALYKSAVEQQFIAFGEKGLRALSVCYKVLQQSNIAKEDENEMVFAGFILLQDPVKSEIVETIAALKKLAVKLKIITGDNKNVARAIALKIGIENPVVLTGQEIFNTSTAALVLLVKKTHIFAEVEPHQKERIIHALRKSYTVAYMGDGINDVSAISAADVGISVENAVDVAREAADFVLMEKNLMVLVEGIKEGRKTFANTLKYIFINTGSTFGNMFSVAIASLILPFLPMLPKQILLTNFITDFPYLTIASDNVDEEQLEKPGKWNLKFIRNYMVIFGIHSSIFDVITFLTLYYVLKVKASAFQTGWFVESILTELFILFIIRTHKNFFKSTPGKYLFLLSVLGLVLTIGLPYTPFAAEAGLSPLPLLNIAVMLAIVVVYILTADLLKVWFFKKYKTV